MKTKWRVRYTRDDYFYAEKEKTWFFGLFSRWVHVYTSTTKEDALDMIQKLKNPIVYQEQLDT